MSLHRRDPCPFTKSQEKESSHRNTLHSWHQIEPSHSFREHWCGALTPFTLRTSYCHTSRTGSRKASNLQSQRLCTSSVSLCAKTPNEIIINNTQKNFFLPALHLWEECLLPYSTKPFLRIFNHLVHCSSFPENSYSTTKHLRQLYPNIYIFFLLCSKMQRGASIGSLH